MRNLFITRKKEVVDSLNIMSTLMKGLKLPMIIDSSVSVAEQGQTNPSDILTEGNNFSQK